VLHQALSKQMLLVGKHNPRAPRSHGASSTSSTVLSVTVIDTPGRDSSLDPGRSWRLRI